MKMTRQQIAWLLDNEQVGYEIYKQGYERGKRMRWPEMVFWMCLVAWLMSQAVGGLT